MPEKQRYTNKDLFGLISALQANMQAQQKGRQSVGSAIRNWFSLIFSFTIKNIIGGLLNGIHRRILIGVIKAMVQFFKVMGASKKMLPQLATIAKLNTFDKVQILRLDDPTGNNDVPLSERSNKANEWGGGCTCINPS